MQAKIYDKNKNPILICFPGGAHGNFLKTCLSYVFLNSTILLDKISESGEWGETSTNNDNPFICRHITNNSDYVIRSRVNESDIVKYSTISKIIAINVDNLVMEGLLNMYHNRRGSNCLVSFSELITTSIHDLHLLKEKWLSREGISETSILVGNHTFSSYLSCYDDNNDYPNIVKLINIALTYSKIINQQWILKINPTNIINFNMSWFYDYNQLVAGIELIGRELNLSYTNSLTHLQPIHQHFISTIKELPEIEYVMDIFSKLISNINVSIPVTWSINNKIFLAHLVKKHYTLNTLYFNETYPTSTAVFLDIVEKAKEEQVLS